MLEAELGRSAKSPVIGRTLLDRVEDTLGSLGAPHVWVRGAGRHVLMGLAGQAAFARITALGSGSYGLSFEGGMDGRWELLLIDDLRSVLGHALVGGDAAQPDVVRPSH